jgi:hypothetical protein
MLCSELKTDLDSCHSSVASCRLRLVGESNPDHAGQTCSNQLVIRSEDVSVIGVVMKTGTWAKSWVVIRVEAATSSSESNGAPLELRNLGVCTMTSDRATIGTRLACPVSSLTGGRRSMRFCSSLPLETDGRLTSLETDPACRDLRGRDSVSWPVVISVVNSDMLAPSGRSSEGSFVPG